MERERGMHKNTHITYRSKRSRTCGGGTISYTCSTRGFPGFFQLAKNWRMISARLCAILVRRRQQKSPLGPAKHRSISSEGGARRLRSRALARCRSEQKPWCAVCGADTQPGRPHRLRRASWSASHGPGGRPRFKAMLKSSDSCCCLERSIATCRSLSLRRLLAARCPSSSAASLLEAALTSASCSE